MYSFFLCVLLLGSSESSKNICNSLEGIRTMLSLCAYNIFLEISDEPSKSNTHDKNLVVYMHNQQQLTWKVMD